jgi:hypothetical protein
MCGPIAIALPIGMSSRSALFLSRIWYNLGRIVTYVLFGLIAGLFGDLFRLGGFQRGLSIALGAMILLAVLLPSKVVKKVMPGFFSTRISDSIKRQWSRLFGHSTQSSLFVIGVLNGFLPCGLVYAAMAAAAVEGGVDRAMLYMVAFGFGTFPLMLVTSLFGQAIPQSFRRRLNRLIPVGAVVLGVILVLRGMALGIPYISPGEMGQGHHHMTETEMQ